MGITARQVGKMRSITRKLENHLAEETKLQKEKKEKKKQAVALSYEVGDEAPRIIAAGKGEVAERIIEKAKESDVPLYKDSKLASTLGRLEIGDTIPPELYEVVAEILIFVDDMDRLRGKVMGGK